MNRFVKLFVSAAVALTVVTATPAMAKKAAKEPSLVDVAAFVNSADGPFPGAFDTLIMLATMDAEIAAVLTSKGQRTVFAPTDDAFDTLFAVASDNCIDLTAETVNAVLKYHVVKGRRGSEDILESDNIRTLLGAFFAQDGGVIIDNAGQVVNFVATDVPASNGIIHAIDTVLLPFPVENACED